MSMVERLPCVKEALALADGPQLPNPFRVLGALPSAGAEELREAYLARLKEHPRESDPEGFELVKRSWAALRSPLHKAAATIDWHEGGGRLADVIAKDCDDRLFVGPEQWLLVAMTAEELKDDGGS